jgi:hypothetical protein
MGRARRIRQEGFQPRKPSKMVWFTRSVAYARGRARTQARRARDRAIVLSCDVDISRLKAALGSKRVIIAGGNFAVDSPVNVDVLLSQPSVPGEPGSPQELAAWVNEQLGLKHYKGVKPRAPGLVRLAKWVVNRTTERKGKYPRARELFEMARRYLPEWLKGCAFDAARARVFRVVNVGRAAVPADAPPARHSPAEEEALACLEARSPRRRIRGLEILREIGDEDLFEWCLMFLEDESAQVKAAAARIMLAARSIDPEVLVPLVDSGNKIVRAAAVALLAKHEGAADPEWFELGLRDPEAHVRTATAEQMGVLSPAKHRSLFELALYDPNPKVAARAEKLAAGSGLGRRY